MNKQTSSLLPTTDGAYSTANREVGFVALFTKYVGCPLKGIHYVVHAEALGCKNWP